MNKILSTFFALYFLLLAPFPALFYCLCVEQVFADNALVDGCCDSGSEIHIDEYQSSLNSSDNPNFLDNPYSECEVCLNIPLSFHLQNEIILSAQNETLKRIALNVPQFNTVSYNTQSKAVRTRSIFLQTNPTTLILPSLQTVRLLI